MARNINRVSIDISGLDEFRGVIQSTMKRKGNTAGHQMLRKWGVRYLAFVKRRYVKNSRGGGDWRALKASTIRGRRKGKGTGSAAILRDTSTLLAALDIGNPGNLYKLHPGFIEVGFAGAGHGVSRLTIAKLATIHNLGTKTIPARPILVEPDERTLKGMMLDGRVAMAKIIDRAEIKGNLL